MDSHTYLLTLLSGPNGSIELFQISCGVDKIEWRETGKGAAKSCMAKLYRGKKLIMTITVRKRIWSATRTVVVELIMLKDKERVGQVTHNTTRPESLFRHFQYYYKEMTGLDPYLFQ